jgi:tetratricopeptide (TPR) repeat protein
MMNPISDGFAFQPESTCKDVARLLPLMHSNDISANDMFRVLRHLKVCVSCQHTYEFFGDLIDGCLQLFAPGTDELGDGLHIPSFQEILRAAEAGVDEADEFYDEQDPVNGVPDASQIEINPEDTPNDDSLVSIRHREATSVRRVFISWANPSHTRYAEHSGSSLELADMPQMREDMDYSQKAATRLSQAYRLGNHKRYDGAIHLLTSLLNMPMSRSQALRVNYYLGICHAALGQYALSTGFLDEAADWAICGDNMRAVAQIGYALGENHYYTLQCASAIEYYMLSVDALNMIGGAAGSGLDAALQDLKITALLRLVSQYFLRAEFDEAMRLIATIQMLLASNPETSQLSLHRASTAWMSALLSRWVGDSMVATKNIFETLDVFNRYGSPLNIARAHIVASDIILDLVDRHGVATVSGTARAEFAQMAEPYIIQALQLTRNIGDMPGEFMAGLAHIRLLRARNNSEFDRRTILEGMIQQTEGVEQLTLLGQAYTALGDEFLYQNDLNSAAMCYRNALTVLEKADIPAYAIYPRRALYELSEGLVAMGPGRNR